MYSLVQFFSHSLHLLLLCLCISFQDMMKSDCISRNQMREMKQEESDIWRSILNYRYYSMTEAAPHPHPPKTKTCLKFVNLQIIIKKLDLGKYASKVYQSLRKDGCFFITRIKSFPIKYKYIFILNIWGKCIFSLPFNSPFP